MHFSTFITYACILMQYILLFCMSSSFICISHTYVYECMYSGICFFPQHCVCTIHLFDTTSWSCSFRAKYIHLLEYYIIKLPFLFCHTFRLFQNSAAMAWCTYLFVVLGHLGWSIGAVDTVSSTRYCHTLLQRDLLERPIFLPDTWSCQT